MNIKAECEKLLKQLMQEYPLPEGLDFSFTFSDDAVFLPPSKRGNGFYGQASTLSVYDMEQVFLPFRKPPYAHVKVALGRTSLGLKFHLDTVAHEYRHVMQSHLKDFHIPNKSPLREVDAKSFAAAYVKSYMENHA